MKRIIGVFILLEFVFPLIFGQSEEVNHWETIFYSDTIFKYHTNVQGEPDSNWHTLEYNDSSWLEGKGGIGYGDGDDQTDVGQCISLFLRKSFTIIDTAEIAEALMSIDYDDGFVAYLNGVEVARSNMTGYPPHFEQLTTVTHEAVMKTGGKPEDFIIPKSYLNQGNNVLAIEIHNSTIGSSDMSSIIFFFVGLKTENQVYLPTPDWFSKVTPTSLSSNLPIVIITTENNRTIPKEPKIKANLKIIYDEQGNTNHASDEPNIYNGNIGIEIRGHYSSGLPQKPYGIETRDALENNLNVSLLGMPEENDWILLANYNDKVFMRNSLAFHLSRKMGHYAPRTKLCEVILNNSYDGIYVFTEKIKRDKNRVDIARLDLDDNAGDSLTGGYIFKIDYNNASNSWLSDYSPIQYPSYDVYFVYEYPKPDDITTQQKSYIKSFVNTFETVLYSENFDDDITGYKPYIDLNSFVDYFIVSEFTRNVDGYKKSCRFYKDRDKNGGEIHAGPVWDFDWAYKNIPQCITNNLDGSGWIHRINECGGKPRSPDWVIRMMGDQVFLNAVNERYFSLRKTILSNDYLFDYIDSVKTHVYSAQERHYERWDILGKRAGAPIADPVIPTTFDGEIEVFKDWIETRLTWLDNNIPLEFPYKEIKKPTNVHDNISNSFANVFPNPVTHGYVYVKTIEVIKRLEIIDYSGKVVLKMDDIHLNVIEVNTKELQPGLYILNCVFGENHIERAKLIVM